MAYEVNFGTMRSATSKQTAKKTGTFRIAVLGDFSARANSGKLDTGAALAGRKPLKVDCDNLDATLKRFGVNLRLPLGAEGGVVELAVNSMDDFHPDQLYSNLPIFSELSGLRQRLKTPSMFAKAAKEVQAWSGIKFERAPRRRARGAAIPVDGKLSDFARLVGAPTAPAKNTESLGNLLKQAVGPWVVPAKDPRADQLVAAVDSALAFISGSRAKLGALQSRFETTIANLQVTSENLAASRSRITDADFAQETANLSRAQILQQAGTAMVAQANQLPQGVLALLR